MLPLTDALTLTGDVLVDADGWEMLTVAAEHPAPRHAIANKLRTKRLMYFSADSGLQGVSALQFGHSALHVRVCNFLCPFFHQNHR